MKVICIQLDRLVESLILICLAFSIFSTFSLCMPLQELQGYVVVRVADQIGGGLETGCMIWTGAKHRIIRFVHLRMDRMDSVIPSLHPLST